MTTATYNTTTDTGHIGAGPVAYPPVPIAHESAVSWGAVAAGATAAAALSLILLILGAGLGLSVVSPWRSEGITASAFGISTVVWLAVTQLLASGLGGYIAGRLRRVWNGVHTDEMYFRDTVHGLLSWAVATLATAALLGSFVASALGTGAQVGATLAGGAATAAAGAVTAGAAAAPTAMNSSQREVNADNMRYYVDALFRKDPAATGAAAATPATGTPDASAGTATMPGNTPGAAQSMPAAASADNAFTAESNRIFGNAVRAGSLPAEDSAYLARSVALRTGLTPQEAQQRVNDTFARVQAQRTALEALAKDQAEKARKATVHAALWTFVSLLIGAFVASLFATIGSRQRFAL